jgi:phytanoyl-CoA hydroxylase
MVLAAEEKARFERDGFLVLEGFVAPDACDALRARMAEMLEAFDPAELRTVFDTRDQEHGKDAYFLGSGDTIRFFLEPGALDNQGRLRQAKSLSINKVGHALHDLDPVFDGFSRAPRLAELAADLELGQPLLLQSMYIFKQPRIGGEVMSHQDSTFLHTEPESCIGFWFALEDAKLENGCMWAEPGGHRRPLAARLVREGLSARMVTLGPTPLPTKGLAPLEARKGTLIVLHGRLPHRSGPNLSDRSRHAYALHLIDGCCRYSPDNWLQRRADMPLRGFA